MDRKELIRMFALDAFADDRESIQQISEDVTRLAGECGLTVELPEIVQALAGLVKDGCANLYRYYADGKTPDLVSGVPPQFSETNGDSYYFQITERGMELEMADYKGWPFDNKGALREGWEPPL